MLKLLRSKGFLLVAVLAAVLVLSSAVFAIDTTKAIFLINGSLGDNSFYDSGEAGMKALAEEFGLDYRTIECGFDSAQYEPGLNAAVQFADIIFVISYGYEDILTQYADDFPDKIFVNLDTTVQNPGGTITSVDYVEEESAYLAGVVAALVTSSDMPKANAEKIIGVVGGDTDPTVQSFIFAYKNGAEYIDPDVRTEVKFLGDWENSSKGKQAALQLYDQGADIVFQVAAAAGMGVLQASGERDLYSIGVDSNQNAIVPGHVVASDIKDVGLSIQNVYRTIVDGTYKPGEVLDYGLASGTVDVVFEDNGGILPQEIIDKVAEVRDMIMNGELAVERYSVE
ncbi:BMP family ABC transporter substrate-binding protein [Anaerolineaceae bacterium oral taxon 439]|nr:BMP family ABC transporter substrate-binding protein [Anaerolineaceae bacterium oral taxon 439]